MSELVTSTSAVSQFGLFAPRQQVFVVERSGSAPDDVTAAESAQGGLHSVVASATASRREDPSNASSLAVHDGPSRARIEIRSLDLGLTPSEVVGTQDVLQRFDNNGDGRVDLLESDKATLSRQTLSTYAAVGGAEPAPPAEVAPVIVNSDSAAAAPVPEDALPGEPKKFSVPVTPDGRPAAQKYADTAAAAGGAPTGTVAVEKKFYGKGTEVIAGQAAAHTAPATNIHDRTVALKQQGVIKEDGTSETRLYDKVSQSERQHQQAGGHSSEGAGTSLRERARQIAEAINGSKKTVLIQVAAYSNTAAASTKQAAIVVENTDVTA
jgi:hypothetical protein